MGERLTCKICETLIPANLLEEHSNYCRIIHQCLEDIEACNELFVTIITTMERRTNQIPTVGASDPQRLELSFIKSVSSIARRSMDLDQVDDVQAACTELVTSSRGLHISDPFLKTMLQQVLESTERKAKAIQIIRHSMATNATSLKIPTDKVRQPQLEDFTILKTLSRGSFGKVFLVKKNSTRDYYALKVLKKGDLARKNQLDQVMNERKLLTMINSPFVIKLYYSFQTVDSLYMVMEYANGGDVNMLLTSVGVLTESWARFYAAEIVLALEHIHSLGIVHRDIKPDNLLITPTGHIKLTDFGLSRDGVIPRHALPQTSSRDGESIESICERLVNLKVDQDVSGKYRHSLETRKSIHQKNRANSKEALYSYVGTPDYVAPEVILGRGHNERIDWWTLGVCLYEFLVGLPPFYEETIEGTYQNILTRSLEWPNDLSPTARDLIDRLLTIDPDQRLGANGAEEVKAHPFFKSIDWENLFQAEASFVPIESNIENAEYFSKKHGEDFYNDPSFLLADEENPGREEGFDSFQFKNIDLLHELNVAKSKAASFSISSLPTTSMVPEPSSKRAITLQDDRPIECLVAEDNPVTQMLAKALMQQLGITLTQAHNGRQAVEKAFQTKFDIIFMDIMMPEMDGIEATKRIRTNENSMNKKTPVIAFTALSDWNKDHYSKAGMNGILAKPFTKNELYNILQEWLSADRKNRVHK